MHAGAGRVRAGPERLGQAGLDDGHARRGQGCRVEECLGNGMAPRGAVRKDKTEIETKSEMNLMYFCDEVEAQPLSRSSS